MPPGAAPDETRHLSRVYVMSEGVWRVPGANPPRVTIPRSIPDLYRSVNGDAWPQPPPPRTVAEMAAYLRQPLEPNRTVGIANAGTYTPVVYLPHLVGVAPARWLGLAPAAMIYLGRIASVLAWVALTALAIRIAPARKWTLALLALAPMSVASAASISGDPVTNAAAFLFAAVFVRAAVGRGPLSRGEIHQLLGASLFLATAKAGYWPLALAALAIPAERVGGRARQLALAAGVAVAVAGPSLAWISYAQTSAPAPPIAGSDPAGQLAWVLANPLAFAGVFARTLVDTMPKYWTTFVGELGPLIVRLPLLVYAAWLAALVAAIAADGPPAQLGRAQRNWLALAFVASIVTMFAMAYLGWNPIGEPVIRGVQGRYWAPAVPLLVFALPARSTAMPERVRIALGVVAIAALVAAIAGVFAVYYRS